MEKLVIHDPDLHQKVERIWAWLAVDENGNSGICAYGKVDEANGVIQHFPLVTGDEGNIEAMQEIAELMMKRSSKKVVMAEFVRVTR